MTTEGQRSSIAGMVEQLGTLEPGQLGFIIASPGVGKSALIAELAVERALENQSVLHVALNEPVAHVRRHYDEVFKALEVLHRTDHQHVIQAERNRLILSYAARTFSVGHLREHLRPFVDLGQFHPTFVVVDEIAAENVAGCIKELSALAADFKAPLWLTVDDKGASGGAQLLSSRSSGITALSASECAPIAAGSSSPFSSAPVSKRRPAWNWRGTRRSH
jgi:hypothetical protein